uniref:Putative ATP-dependent endonuclease of the OLD family n=1 Tax=Candidatus Kentrum sp. FW TaxID=2126338 RepID=A0A450TQU1_9GAMM|nr:MAG: putative ATP-dependent endonuclease of the OLD family [Candidatus Kentron sp. FW]
MQISRLVVKNFRSIEHAEILLPRHAVLIGDNNIGKTTLIEAINLVLGPDRLNRQPPINEHDFFQSKYLAEGTEDAETTTDPPEVAGPEINIEVTITDLTEEQKAHFGDHVEFWDESNHALYNEPNPAGVDGDSITEALRVSFIGRYDREEDDFEGKTYFTRSLTENDNPQSFTKRDKRNCGFLYLRSLRTGSRALSLERGSLLDIILHLREIRPQMWENTLDEFRTYAVAADQTDITRVLESINAALKKYVPKEWGDKPHLKVSNLTRDHLRKVITAFVATGNGNHSVPFYLQSTGTINMLVLAMLSQIAEDKQNVIFAMEEPETAIPPYAQKRIVHEVRKLSSQAIFTSHSPYVLEEFTPDETVVLARTGNGDLERLPIELPNSVKPKRYRQEFRTRFCEGLLARRVLIAEGATEATAFPAVCRRLAELNPEIYASLESLGICTIDAGSETQIAPLAGFYRGLGKQTFAICDKQTDERKAQIETQATLFMHGEKGFEDLVFKGTTQEALVRFAGLVDWPLHILEKYLAPNTQPVEALWEYFRGKKAEWGIADFLAQCNESEIPDWLRNTCFYLKMFC